MSLIGLLDVTCGEGKMQEKATIAKSVRAVTHLIAMLNDFTRLSEVFIKGKYRKAVTPRRA